MVEENPDLGFSHPKEGFNIFIDAMWHPEGLPEQGGRGGIYQLPLPPGYLRRQSGLHRLFHPGDCRKGLSGRGSDVQPRLLPGRRDACAQRTFAELGVEATQVMNDLWLSVKTSTSNTTLYLILTIAAIAASDPVLRDLRHCPAPQKARRCRKWKQA